MITDNPSVITSVVRDGVRKTVSNYARSAPLRLEGFEEAIDVVAARCEMELVSQK